jgi:hypothetical protein
MAAKLIYFYVDQGVQNDNDKSIIIVKICKAYFTFCKVLYIFDAKVRIMKINLFPQAYKKIGLALVFLSILLIIVDQFNGLWFLENIKALAIYNSGTPLNSNVENEGFFKIVNDDFRFEIIVVLMLVGLILFGFSKRQNEDEMIQKIRLNSLVWATYAHFLIFILFTIFTFGVFYLNFLLIGVFTILIIYIIRFEYKIFLVNRDLK